MEREQAEVFAMLLAVPPSEKHEELGRAGSGTKTTWSGTDKDD